ncbi:hypothetical protein K2173_024351 [Erythroxylum novogranatense]|uniref:Nuclease associated modular domain-containing protein n=1 Tax=Erythroxylum novogranatense TaxID=1862640 RepID=A0AAV8SUX4_9ROSI|nr:hypothetical protein K2173_024351 [Erythroxylum novogranatense]
MPLLDIVFSQASSKYHLGPLRAQFLIPCKGLSRPFTFGDSKRLLSVWTSLQLPKTVDPHRRSKLWITAVTTLEPKCLVSEEDGSKIYKDIQLDADSDSSVAQVESSNSEWVDLDDRERLRRIRISKANKGNTPWNKGRKHSAETRQKIRERTRLAMQNPKVKMKLVNLGHAQSEETRLKIGVGVRMGWQKRREKQTMQETCYFEWQNLIAEASRNGYSGEEELQWDSYKTLSEKLEQEWLESIERRKSMPRPKGSKRAPKSLEQRRKIAEAIAAKWADPGYRERVCSALSKYHGTPVGTKPKPRRKPRAKQDTRKTMVSNSNNSPGNDPADQPERKKLRRSKMPLYKDPLASSKLEMLKNIRAKRTVTETKKSEAIERARFVSISWIPQNMNESTHCSYYNILVLSEQSNLMLYHTPRRLLIAEAQKAAKALEVAAAKSPVAQASLVETRRLIAEAMQLVESIDPRNVIRNENDHDASLAARVPTIEIESEEGVGKGSSSDAGLWEVNGSKLLVSAEEEKTNLTKFTFHDVLNGDQKEFVAKSPNGYGLSQLSLNTLIQESNSAHQTVSLKLNGVHKSGNISLVNGSKAKLLKEGTSARTVPSTKKWIRGRLVEVTEGDQS